jgi:hypothetical protein
MPSKNEDLSQMAPFGVSEILALLEESTHGKACRIADSWHASFTVHMHGFTANLYTGFRTGNVN